MIVDLDVPAVQIAVPVLHARFDGPRRAHLSTLTGRVAAPAGSGGAGAGRTLAVHIGILAASHQVLLDGRVVETVTCDDPTGRALRPGTRIDLPHLTFRADVVTCASTRFDAAIDQLLAEAEADADATDADGADGADRPSTLVARFPDDPRALTTVTLTDRGWRTTHTYPSADGGVLVTTRTELR